MHKIVKYFLLVNLLTIYCSTSKPIEDQIELKKQNNVSLPENIMSEINKICPDCRIASLDDLNVETREEFLELTSNNTPGLVEGDFDGNGLVDYAVLVWKEGTSTKGVIQHIEKVIVFTRYKKGIKSHILLEYSYEDPLISNPCIPEKFRKSRIDLFLRFGTEEECKFDDSSGGYTTIGKRSVPVIVLSRSCIPKEFINSGACGVFIIHGLSTYLRYIPAGELVKATESVELLPGEPAEVTLKLPGIELTFSEQSSRVFYWNEKGKTFSVIWTSD